MKLLTASQIREWDQYTIKHEPVSSVELMERAARVCAKWLLQNTMAGEYFVFCGKGNNGGDGLALARILSEAGHTVNVFISESEAVGSNDYVVNFNHLQQWGKVPVKLIRNEHDLPVIPHDAILVDALFGTGLNRRLGGNAEMLVQHLNASGNAIISIDIPSGMMCDESSIGYPVVTAHHTLTFQCLKTAFLVAENEPFFGQVHILDINLHPDFPDTISTRFKLVNKARCQSIYKPRKEFAHKGDFGHALLVAGSYGKMGAAVLSAKACMRSGVGLLSCHVPSDGVPILQTTVPEAMCIGDEHKKLVSSISVDTQRFQAIGAGPALGTEPATASMLHRLITHSKQPLVLDADALNILAEHPEWLETLPAQSVLTPHPKEFERLFGKGMNDFQKIEKALEKAQELNIVIVLKGHYSFIALPDGTGWFNITGNAGMATGGSGDVLTGLLTGLLAQGYAPADAAAFGVFLHGLAGDFAAAKYTMEGMTAGDIIAELPNAWSQVTGR